MRRSAAAKALEKLNYSHAVGQLILSLDVTIIMSEVRLQEILGRMGDKSAVEPLVLALQDKEWSIRPFQEMARPRPRIITVG